MSLCGVAQPAPSTRAVARLGNLASMVAEVRMSSTASNSTLTESAGPDRTACNVPFEQVRKSQVRLRGLDLIASPDRADSGGEIGV